MTKTVYETENQTRLIEFIISEILRRGLKATTMDSLASSLQMSKRTLYEIFGSKDEMIKQAFGLLRKRTSERYSLIFKDSENLMEALLNCLLYNRDILSRANINFFKDLDEYRKSRNCENIFSFNSPELLQILNKGIEEGYFRNNLNSTVQCRMLGIQMESLKRMEEIFPEDISLLEVYDSICFGFLRSIASEKGMKIIDKLQINLNR